MCVSTQVLALQEGGVFADRDLFQSHIPVTPKPRSSASFVPPISPQLTSRASIIKVLDDIVPPDPEEVAREAELNSFSLSPTGTNLNHSEGNNHNNDNNPNNPTIGRGGAESEIEIDWSTIGPDNLPKYEIIHKGKGR